MFGVLAAAVAVTTPTPVAQAVAVGSLAKHSPLTPAMC
jgi:hypothetical protein